MAYPLDVGGVDGYPVKAGSMLLTMVDPNPGYEKAYNRWYERDHFYAGCMIGPFLFAGSRWVATRDLKDKRWPQTDTVARPYNAGSYISIYWVEEGHYDDHLDQLGRHPGSLALCQRPRILRAYPPSHGRLQARRRELSRR